MNNHSSIISEKTYFLIDVFCFRVNKAFSGIFLQIKNKKQKIKTSFLWGFKTSKKRLKNF